MAILYIFIALATVSAFGILLCRTVLNAALCLMVCLLSIAGIYIVLQAEFLAIVQILVYAGGVVLLIIFGIMVTRTQHDVRPVKQIPAFLLGALLTILLWTGLRTLNTQEVVTSDYPAEQIGIDLMTQYAAPFEIGGILILVSMIGAMIIASFQKQN